MEGELQLWAHRLPWGKWKRRYFILTDNVLSYCRRIQGDVIGRLHMKVATVESREDDPRVFKIFSGMKELKLRAEDEAAKLRWLKALRGSQTSVISEEATIGVIRQALQRTDGTVMPESETRFLLAEEPIRALDERLSSVFELQALFSSQLAALKATSPASQKALLDGVADASAQLKKSVNEAVKLLREERDRLTVVHEVLRRRVANGRVGAVDGPGIRTTLEEMLEEKTIAHAVNRPAEATYLDDSKFYSVMGDVDEIERVKASFFVPDSARAARSPPRSETVPATTAIPPAALPAATLALISSNAVFVAHPVAIAPAWRTCMPVARAQMKIDIWGLLKNNIGKDLSRISMPIYLNEPISMLQKVAEVVEFVQCLRKANRESDPMLRLCFLLAFQYSTYPHGLYRLKKPFNPMLGETYELFHEETRFIAEQVSHHPPVVAFYFDSPDFVFEGTLNLVTNLSLSGFQIVPTGGLRLTLKATGECFTMTRPRSSLHNFIVGQMYIWQSGESSVVNQASGASALLFFKPKGWGARHDYECEGKVVDGTGHTHHHLYGKWNSFLRAMSSADKTELSLVQAPPMPADAAQNYFFTEFQMNLNSLDMATLARLPPTDSRLRPDQRAYEHGDLELATAEKARLEDKQRTLRRQLEARGEEWRPRWFEARLLVDGQKDFFFKGEYFNVRETGKWPSDLPDLFS